MTETIDRVQASWALAATDADRMSRLFYSCLFRIDPRSKTLFAGDMKLQGRKLAQTLSFIVDNLEEPDNLLPAAVQLAKRHVGYGVTPEQYDAVGAALIDALKQILGQSFSAQDEAAWRETYDGLARAMVSAAYQG